MTVRYSQKYGWESEVFSRASESITRWGVDLVFIHVLLREIGKELDFTPEEVKLHWNSASMFQSILATPLFLVLSGREKELHKKKTISRWQEQVQKRYRDSFLGNKYHTFKTQVRAAKAYDIARGDIEAKHILTPDDLQIPYVDLTLPKGYLTKGGFR